MRRKVKNTKRHQWRLTHSARSIKRANIMPSNPRGGRRF
uniref:DNA binding protein ORF8 n=1 Tax=Spiroplasma virus 4 TaxID=2928746 RepID=J_SPV4|nr:RecName: Full=DNA binding protein ORF8 [Spiroplasma phage 4]